MLPDLRIYQEFEPTKSCYLDGRYFNLVFSRYPGLVSAPLEIYMDLNENGMEQSVSLNNIKFKDNDINILRVIINTPETRHSGVLLIDMENSNGYYFDCAMKTGNNVVINMMSTFLNMDIEWIALDTPYEQTPGCEKSGFCVAYSIKFAYDYLLNVPYDFNNIRRFSAAIEDAYEPLDPNNKDIEYGEFAPVFLGAVGGGLIGGLVGGVPGALVGAGIGGFGGYALAKSSPQYYSPYSQDYNEYDNY